MESRYNITAAKYYQAEMFDGSQIKVKLDNSTLWTFFPNESGNDLYDEIMKQVAAGDLTIADAD